MAATGDWDIRPVNLTWRSDVMQLAALLTEVEDLPCSVAELMQFLFQKAAVNPNPEVCVLGAFCGPQLRAMVYAEGPHPLSPDTAYLVLGVSLPHTPRWVNEQLLQAAEEWAVRLGARKWQMMTRRSRRAWHRRYGFRLAADVCLERDFSS